MGAKSQSLNDEARETEAIAIVGMACRLPGGITNTSELWEFLVDGKSGQGEIPESRFNAGGFYHPNADRSGSIISSQGYFIQEDIRLFDNTFFGINNLEAKYMDPQQRQLLEVVFECFESAGATLHELSGANVGCYVANFTTDYVTIQSKDPESYHRYSATGFGSTILANRISHVFNLRGPSCVLDTACSSSLYALHAACAALSAGECEAAVVAGANLIQSPEMHMAMVKAGVLSATSTSHTFDASADGYGRGEGIGALYLKRLGNAMENRDPVRSVIRGTAVNSNGHTPGIMLPSASGQAAVIRKAYDMAGLARDNTAYVEAHGTGTPVGDPIEVAALSQVLHLANGKPLLIGSVKTNLGHSEAVSGITSVIKTTLALENRLIPPTIGVRNINPELKLTQRNVEVVMSPMLWPEGTTLRAGINSFGYGGANAHAILEAANIHLPEGYESNSHKGGVDRIFILPFSAHRLESLMENVASIASTGITSRNLANLTYTLGSRRSILPVRGYLIAHEDSLNETLIPGNLKLQDSDIESLPQPFAFVFTGQGAQWPGMGRQLYQRFPTYRRTIQYLDACLARLQFPPSWTIEGVIMEPAETSEVHKALYSQPVCTAIQIALVEVLRDWNVEPTAVIGHSSGEICAAFSAGYLTADEAITVAYYRGLSVSKLPFSGSMMAVGMSQEKVAGLISKLKLDEVIQVACVNSPESTTISGDSSAVESFYEILQSQGIFSRKLKTDDKAYHSSSMSAIGQNYEDLLSSILQSKSPECVDTKRVAFYSSVTCGIAGKNLVYSAGYWRTNLESPVMFKNALEGLLSSRSYHFIEIGPHPVLEQPVRETAQRFGTADSRLLYFSTLFRGQNAEISMLQLAGNLYLSGHLLLFNQVNNLCTDKVGALHCLPPYAWTHDKALWTESRISSEFRNRRHPRHDLLGSRVFGGLSGAASWKNQLKVREVPWLQDHKLGPTTVFPASGYIAMAVEALYQMQEIDGSGPLLLKLKQIHIINVLVLSDDSDGVEMWTYMEPAQISSVTSSSTWWKFEISSKSTGKATVHANGLVEFDRTQSNISRTILVPEDTMEEQATRTWYDKLAKEGLHFGPAFRSLTEIQTDRRRKMACSIAKTMFFQGGGSGLDQQSKYAIHPITIDALLQTAIIASARGNVRDLRGKIPVSIGRIDIAIDNATNSKGLCKTRGSSEEVGLSTVNLDAELENSLHQTIVQIRDVRAIANAAAQLHANPVAERNPALRISWKPDISSIHSTNTQPLSSYIDRFSLILPEGLFHPDIERFAGTLDLYVHKNPGLRIGELEYDGSSRLQETLYLFGLGTSLKRFGSYTKLSISPNGELSGYEVDSVKVEGKPQSMALKPEQLFDVLLIPPSAHPSKVFELDVNQLSGYLTSNASILFMAVPRLTVHLDESRFSMLTTVPQHKVTPMTIARSLSEEPQEEVLTRGPNLLFIDVNSLHPFNQLLRAVFCNVFGSDIKHLSFQDVCSANVPPQSVIITTIELEDSILAQMTEDQVQSVKILSDNATILLWITGGGLFKARRPAFSLVLGLARSLMLERPSLSMPVLDVDDINNDLHASSVNVVYVLRQVMCNPNPEFEYRQYDRILYISRFVPDQGLNKRFRQTQNADVVPVPVQEVGRCSLAMKDYGQLDSIYFKQEPQCVVDLKPHSLEVNVKSVGLNAKDLYALTGRVETKNSTCALEFTGVVTRISAQESEFALGDRVVVMAPAYMSTFEIVPAWACCKMRDEEDFTTLSTVPLVFSTAFHALEERAGLAPGETVLIHSAAGGLGMAAIQVAQLIGAEIYATVGTPEKKQFLIHHYGLKEDHILGSRDSSFLPAILTATSGRGVDVVLNSLTGQLLQDSWQACAEFGRFVEVGKRDINENGRLDMQVFGRGATFLAFDLTDYYWSKLKSKREIWQRLLNRTVQLFRDGKIRAIKPLKVFDASEVTQALRYFSMGNRVGKVAISFESPEAELKIVPFKYRTTFSSEKAYLLVGCLGGLGRSLSRWMLQRGARSFVFLSRSGTDRLSAENLVKDLKAAGADVRVVRGDVTSLSDVKRAIADAPQPIGGVVHAAMGIHVALFTDMSSKTWHMGLDQKVKGAWNIHESLRDRDDQLDFFLILSSIAGSIGTATESNYCAANAFLDAFASHRRSLGKVATSVGLGMISEVGFLHENPEIEAVLLRKGVHPFTEDELLQIIDVSLFPPSNEFAAAIDEGIGNDHYMQGHILTGLELHGFQKIRDLGFSRQLKILEDPRCAVIAGSFNKLGSTDEEGSSGDQSIKNLPRAVSVALTSNEGRQAPSEALTNAVQSVVVDKIGSLLLVPSTQLTKETQLATFGMESMLAAEFRSDIFRAFQVDIPFMVLLNEKSSIGLLTELVVKELLASMIKPCIE